MTDPAAALLQTQDERTAAARALGNHQTALADAVAAYRDAWRAATAAGWAKRDLTRAGFTDPGRLPRIKTSTEADTAE